MSQSTGAWAGKTQEKSNEITAVPELLERLELSGCIVTVDAMGCQREIAKHIRTNGGDYVFPVKGNQGTLEKEVQAYFDAAGEDDFLRPEIEEAATSEEGQCDQARLVKGEWSMR